MGGQWKYKINLISLEPEIIDTVNIYSLLNILKALTKKPRNIQLQKLKGTAGIVIN